MIILHHQNIYLSKEKAYDNDNSSSRIFVLVERERHSIMTLPRPKLYTCANGKCKNDITSSTKIYAFAWNSR